MIRASAVDSRYGRASQGNVARGLSKDAGTFDSRSLVSDPINICAFAANSAKPTRQEAQSSPAANGQSNRTLMAVSLNLLALRCNTDPGRTATGTRGLSLGNADCRRIPWDFPWAAPPSFGPNSRHAWRSHNLQPYSDFGRTWRLVVSFCHYHPSRGPPGRLHDRNDRTGSDPPAACPYQWWTIQARINCFVAHKASATPARIELQSPMRD